jgi:tetratricopeptide (TPR) repeat protein
VLLLVLVAVVGEQIFNRLASDVYLEDGMIAQDQSNWSDAYLALEKSLDLNQYSLRSYATLGAVGVAAGRYDAALAAYQALATLDAEYPKLYRGLGDAYEGLGRHQEALNAFLQDAKLEHTSTTMLEVAEAYAKLGQMDLALRYADEAVRIVESKPPWPHIEAAEVYLRRASLRAQAGQRQGALADVKTAMDLKPQSEKPHLALGDIYRGWHLYHEALAEYQKARDLSPQSAQVYTFMGVTYAALGDFSQAVKNYRTSLYIQPDDPFTQLNLGLALRRLGQLAEARKVLQAVAALGPKNPLAQQAEAALQIMGPPGP